MTSAFDEDALRNWLVDYLVTNIGCSPDEIDFDAPLNDLAVGSSDAVVLTGELSELLGRTVSPVAGVVVACAGMGEVSPMEIVKRTSVPVLTGLVLVVAGTLLMVPA